MLTASRLLSMHERRQDIGIGIHTGGDVGDRRAGFGGLLLRAGDRNETGFALDQQVVGFLVAIRTIVTVSGNVAHDDPWFLLRKCRVREPKARRGAGCEILHNDVRLLANQSS